MKFTATAKEMSGALRRALIELGLYGRPIHKVHKNKKKYNRKDKHKGHTE